MAHQDYFYPKWGGDYRFHVQYKCFLAIGRYPIGIENTSDNKTMLRFDPPLDEVTERPLIAAIFDDPNTAGDMPTVSITGNRYEIKDIWECRAELEADIGFPVTMWFPKNAPTDERPNRIVLDFGGKVLSVKDKKDVETAIQNLFIGWV